MKYVIGVDLGTSGTKAVLYSEDGKEINSAYAEYPLYQPDNGWAEQNPEEWAQGVFRAIKDVVKGADIIGRDVVGIGVSGQMHGLVMLDENDNILHNSIIWCDVRAQKQCDDIERIMPDYRKYTLNAPVVGFTLPKLMWVKENMRDVYDRIAHILLPKDYINHILCGGYNTDVTDASGTGFFDVKNRCWSDEVCRAFGTSKEWLANVHESRDKIGKLTSQSAEMLGLCTDTIVVAGAGDQAAAGLGNGVSVEGDTSITLGTSGVVFNVLSAPCEAKEGLHCFCHAIPGKWHGMAVTQGCGLSVKWFRDNLAKDMSYKLLDSLAERISVGSDGLIFLPYLMGERAPHPSADIRGGFIGLSASHSTGQMYRAVLEGVNFSLCECLNLMNEENCTQGKILVGGGGAKSNTWLKMLADCIGKNISVLKNAESGTRGVAILASLGSGLYKSIESSINVFVDNEHRLIEFSDDNFAEYKEFLPLYSELFSILKEHNRRLRETVTSHI